MEYADTQYRLGALQGGSTVREHYESLRRQTGLVHEDLLTECPETAQYLWNYHLEISARRTRNAKGAGNPISISELDAWMRITGVTLEQFELEALDQLDRLHMGHQ